MVVIKHQILLGQEIQVKRSDGTWHDAIITEIVVAHPEKFWEFPQASDHIKVIFADRYTKSILQQELDDVLRPVCDIAGLIRCRREELFTRLTPEEDDIFRAMAKLPIMIERPILWRGERAVIGRPPERILELLDDE